MAQLVSKPVGCTHITESSGARNTHVIGFSSGGDPLLNVQATATSMRAIACAGYEHGSVSTHGRLYFDEVTIDGRTGSIVMQAQGRLAAGATEWTGHWTILSASGGLDGLHGHGSWWGPGAGEPNLPGVVYYDGKVHFSR